MTTLAQKISRIMADFFGAGAGNPLSNRNLIVDGNFDSWISGSVNISNGASTTGAATMYYAGSGTGGATTITQGLVALGGLGVQSLAPPVKFTLGLNQTTASTGTPAANTSPFVATHLEGVRATDGRTMTFSFYAWLNSGSATVTPLWQQNYGTGGTPTASPPVQLGTPITLTTTPTRYSISIPWASLSGVTLGTNGNDVYQVGFWFSGGSIYQAFTSQWQLEYSSPQAPAIGIPTAFEYRGYGPELARVQRYYNVTGCVVNTALAYLSLMRYPVDMRAVPGLTILSINTGSGAGVAAVGNTYYYQSVANSAQGVITVAADARL